MAHNKIYVINAFNHTHQWGTWIAITPATCTTEGVETRNCLLDAAHTETRASAINPNAHQWGVYRVLIQATETTDGAETRTCSRDSSHIETRTGAAALGHVWGDWTVTNAATETDDGEESITCTICGEVKEICFSGEYATGTPGLWSGDNITVSDGAVIIGKVNSSIARGDAVIPAYVLYEGGYLPVTSIGDYAFASCTGLTSITIPAGVTTIGSAFEDWTSSQTINVRGCANRSAADSAWGSNWRHLCNATIKYWNGSSYQ